MPYNGRPVKIAGYNKDAAMYCQVTGWIKRDASMWCEDGSVDSHERPADLFMAPTERKEWIVRRETGCLIGPFDTLIEAQRCSNTYYNSTIHEITINE